MLTPPKPPPRPQLRLTTYRKPAKVVVDRARWGRGSLYKDDRLDVLGHYCVASGLSIGSFQWYSNLTYLRQFEGVTIGGPFVESDEAGKHFTTSAFQAEVMRANDHLQDASERELVLISLFRSIDVLLEFEGAYVEP